METTRHWSSISGSETVVLCPLVRSRCSSS
ncbi:hypothetical protein Ae717Ps2_6793 [Pseudonocardia sp. Ae717_Ps2]|nr:hypothetical protein Ae717Ps2_6793 [Pseudonocardia sp. Ae717_Ps2]